MTGNEAAECESYAGCSTSWKTVLGNTAQTAESLNQNMIARPSEISELSGHEEDILSPFKSSWCRLDPRIRDLHGESLKRNGETR